MADDGPYLVHELERALGDQPVYLRAALEGTSRLTLRNFDAFVGLPPPDWNDFVWRYDDVVLISETFAADTLKYALTDESNRTFVSSAGEVSVPSFQQQGSWRREPSLTHYRGIRLPWPSINYTIHRSDGATQRKVTGVLVGDGCPSFRSFDHACKALFQGDFSTIGANAAIESGMIHIAQSEAWLGDIKVTATYVDVAVLGENAAGTELSLNGASYRAATSITKAGNIRLPLPAGIPDDAWLFLSRGFKWLDYRPVGPHVATSPDGDSSGVVYVHPDDSRTRLEAVLAVGEGPRTEYKSALPGNTDSDKRKILKTVAAFANEDGGDLVFGVSPDEVTVVGVEGDPRKNRDRIADLIKGFVVPCPRFHVEEHVVDGASLLMLVVEPGPNRPYGLRFGNGPVEHYVRRGASTFAASYDDIRFLAREGLD